MCGYAVPAGGRLRPVNPIVAQVLTIAGVLLGSAATFFVTSSTERTRWRRAQSARWDDKRLLAYSEYATAVKHMVRLCRRIAETRGLLATGQPIDQIKRDSDRDRWFTAAEAKDYGFIDHVVRRARQVPSGGAVS